MRDSRHGRLFAALLVCGAVLSACGGDEGPSRPGSRIGEAGPEPGAPPVGAPGMEGGPASVWASAALGGADALFATSAREESGYGDGAVHDTGCSGLSCSGSGGGRIGIGNAGPFASAGVDERIGGIDVVSASDFDAESWGGWMRHAGFGVLLEREGMGAGLREARYGLALGELTEVAEGQDIRATWRGRMVGVTEGGGFSDGRLQGVAVLTYRSVVALGDDAEDGDVVGRIDAAFTDIASVSTGASFADARFENVPVTFENRSESRSGQMRDSALLPDGQSSLQESLSVVKEQLVPADEILSMGPDEQFVVASPKSMPRDVIRLRHARYWQLKDVALLADPNPYVVRKDRSLAEAA